MHFATLWNQIFRFFPRLELRAVPEGSDLEFRDKKGF